MKKHPKEDAHPKKHARRNVSTGGAAIAHPPRSRRVRLPRRAPPPPWKTIAAAVAGGGVSAAVSGLVVNQKVLSPEAVGIGLMLGGGAAAYFADGNTRVVGAGMASVGAGQLALALMAKQALKGQSEAAAQNQNAPAHSQPAQLSAAHGAPTPAPPPAIEPPRRSANDGGVVVDLFRDAVNDLDMIEDAWRYGVHDHRDVAEPLVIDLDEPV
jgi:hypothetical protein